MAERYNEVKNVSDIFRRINSINEMSQKAQEEDFGLTKKVIRTFEQTKDGLVEVSSKDEKDFMTYAKEAIGYTKLNISFKKLDERAVIPTYAHDGDVGMDLTAIDVEYDSKNDVYIYHTGLAFESEKHYGIFLFPRSSNRNTEAYLTNHVGIADSATYRGEIMLCFKNRTSLRQDALESRMVEFWNAIEDGKSIEEATMVSVKGWMEAMNNPMLFAPYKQWDRVAQMVVFPYPEVKLIERQQLSETERGDGGFGSTDKKD